MKSSTASKIKNYFNTLKYLKSRQVFFRFYYLIRNKFFFTIYLQRITRAPTPDWDLNFVTELSKQFSGDKNENSKYQLKYYFQKFCDIKNRKFNFLNNEVVLTDPIDWEHGKTNKFDYLWNYNLHYFDFIKDCLIYFKMSNNDDVYNTLKEIISSWIKFSGNKSYNFRGWEPYPVSRRLGNFLNFKIIFNEHLESDQEFDNILRKSMYLQLLHLSKSIEYQVDGNHLLEDGYCLFKLASLFNCEAANNIRRMSEKLLFKELKVQFLNDGGHYEKSPMYHCILLEGLIEVYLVNKIKKATFFELSKIINNTLIKGGEFLSSVLHPDKKIPLLNDSIYGTASEPNELISLINFLFNDEYKNMSEESKIFCEVSFLFLGVMYIPETKVTNDTSIFNLLDSGYLISKNNYDYIIYDFGNIGPDFVLGHAHCDTFSFELTKDKKRLIVDSGVYSYANNKMRAYNRSTKAHNTVEVEKLDQSEVWSSFRVAKRAKVTEYFFKKFEDNSIYTSASHDGYLRLSQKVKHQREMYYDFNLLIIEDNLVSNNNRLFTANSYIHFHPGVDVIKVEMNKFLIDNKYTLQIYSNNEVFSEVDDFEHWYSSTLGVKEKMATVKICGKGKNGKIRFGYILYLNSLINYNNVNNLIIEGRLKGVSNGNTLYS